MKNIKKAFTLVELIVVITILAILWTIVFISFQWYSQSSRNSVRISDVNKVESALELFFIDSWKYPDPTNPVTVTYNWSDVWYQGTFWSTTNTSLWTISKVITDPLLNIEYGYSVSNTKTEYQIWLSLEWWPSGFNNSKIINSTYAIDSYAYVTWSYNWRVLKVSSWWIDYVLAVPSIITTDLTNLDLSYIISNDKLVYNNYINLPPSYKWTSLFNSWSILYNPETILVYSWSISDLKINTAKQVKLLEWIKAAFWESSVLSSNDNEIEKITALQINSENPTSNDIYEAWMFVKNNLKIKDLKVWWFPFNYNITNYTVKNTDTSWLDSVYADLKSIFYDSQWNLWTTYDTGLWVWVRKYNWIEWVEYNSENSDFPLLSTWVDKWIFHIREDLNWNIWFTSNWGGLIKFDWLNWEHYTNLSTWWWLLSDQVTDVLIDSNWNLWVWLRWDWLCMFNWTNWVNYSFSNNQSEFLLEAPNWDIWFWTNVWINVFDGLNWNQITSASTNWWLWADNMQEWEVAPNWDIWVSTRNGWVSKYDWINWIKWTNESTNWWIIGDYLDWIWFDSNWNVYVWSYFWLHKFDWINWEVLDTNWYRYAVAWDNSWNIYYVNNAWFYAKYDWNIIETNSYNWLLTNNIRWIYDWLNNDIWLWTNNWISIYNWNNWSNMNNLITSPSLFIKSKINQWIAWISDWWIIKKYDWINIITYNTNEAYWDYITEDKYWNIWVWNFNNSLSKFNWTNWENIKTFNNYIYAVFSDNDWNIWVSIIWEWIYKFDWINWINYTKENTNNWLNSNAISMINQDNGWNMWFTHAWEWINKFDWNNWISYTKENTDNWLLSNIVYDTLQDNKWNIWFATTSWVTIFNWINWNTIDISNWLSGEIAFTIYEDINWEIWVSVYWLDYYWKGVDKITMN